MTSLIVSNSGVAVSNRIAGAQPPYLANCKGYHLIGGSDAASLENLVDSSKPLIKIGQPTYPASNYAFCDYANGYRTTDNFNTQQCTAIIVCTNPRNSADTGSGDNSIKFISMNGGTIYQYCPGSSDQWFVTGSGRGISNALGNNLIATVGNDGAPGITPLSKSRFGFRCVTDTGAVSRLTMQEGSMLKEFTGTPATGPASSPISFCGDGFSADARTKVAAIMYFDRALIYSEVQKVWEFLTDDLESRGIIDAFNEEPYASFNVDFTAITTLPDEIEFTRTTGGGYFDSAGVYQWTPASKNLLLYTQDFENALWNKNSGSVTVSPKSIKFDIGSARPIYADSIIESAANSAHNIYQTFVATTGQTITWSIYVKAKGRSIVQLNCQATSSIYRVEYNLSTMTVTNRAGTGTGTIVDCGNGVYRITATAVATGTGTGYFQLNLCNAANTISYTGDGVSGVYLCAAQVEIGSAVTSYSRNFGGFYPPRFDYDPNTLKSIGLLREDTRSNKFLQTSDFTVTPWAATVTGTSTRTNENRPLLGFPVGVVTATSANGGLRQPISDLTSGQQHVLTFYVESTATSLLVVLENGTSSYGTGCNVTINPSTGGIGTITGFISVSSRQHKTGYIYTIVLPNAGGTLAANIEWLLPTSGNVMRIGAPQFEQGINATTYIPSGATIGTRNAETARITGTYLASIYSSAAGTLFVEADQLMIYAQSKTAVGFWLDSGNRIGIYRQLAGSINGWINAPLVSGQSAVANKSWKAALTWNGSAFAIGANGAPLVTGTYTNSTSFTALEIGDNGGGGAIFNGHIRRLTVYPSRLENSKIQQLTF